MFQKSQDLREKKSELDNSNQIVNKWVHCHVKEQNEKALFASPWQKQILINMCLTNKGLMANFPYSKLR